MVLLLCKWMWKWLQALYLLLPTPLTDRWITFLNISVCLVKPCALFSSINFIPPTQCVSVWITHRRHHLCTGMFQFCQKYVTVSEFLEEESDKYYIKALQRLNNGSKAVWSILMNMEKSSLSCRKGEIIVSVGLKYSERWD